METILIIIAIACLLVVVVLAFGLILGRIKDARLEFFAIFLIAHPLNREIIILVCVSVFFLTLGIIIWLKIYLDYRSYKKPKPSKRSLIKEAKEILHD